MADGDLGQFHRCIQALRITDSDDGDTMRFAIDDYEAAIIGCQRDGA